jgi:hypothetical protein
LEAHVAPVGDQARALVHDGRELRGEAVVGDGRLVRRREDILLPALRPLLVPQAAPPALGPAGEAGRHRRMEGREGPADVRRDALGERPVPPEVPAVGVDHHDPRAVAERRRLAVAQPEVERRPEDQDHVGLAEREPARQLERHRVIVRQAAAPHAVREHGGAGALGEAGQRVPRPVPVHAAPGDDRRALR